MDSMSFEESRDREVGQQVTEYVNEICKLEHKECVEVHAKVMCDSDIVKVETDIPEDVKIEIEDHELSYACLKNEATEDNENLLICDSSLSNTSFGKQLNAADYRKYGTTEGIYDQEDRTKVTCNSDIMKLEIDGPEDFKIDTCLEIGKIDVESKFTSDNCGSEDSTPVNAKLDDTGNNCHDESRKYETLETTVKLNEFINEMNCKLEHRECMDVHTRVICDSDIMKVEIAVPEDVKIEIEEHELSYACLKSEATEDKESLFTGDSSLSKRNCGSEDSKQLIVDDHRKYNAAEGIYNQEVHTKVTCDSDIVKVEIDGAEDVEIDIEEHELRSTSLEIEQIEDMKSMFTSNNSNKANCGSEDSKQVNVCDIGNKVVCVEHRKYDAIEKIIISDDDSEEDDAKEKIILISDDNSEEEVINLTDGEDVTKISDEKGIMKYISGTEKQNTDPAVTRMDSQHYELKIKDKHHLKKHFKFKHDSGEWYKCQHCEFKTKVQYYLKRHFKLEHNCTIEDFKCQHCEFETKDKHILMIHSKFKHDEWYKCEYCEFKTKSKDYLNKHFKVKHDDSAECYKCQHCKFETKIKYKFNQHFRWKHDDSAKWYKCQHCEYKTKRKDDLEKHFIVKHDNRAEWYKCQHCEFKTKNKYSLKAHCKRKHDDSGEWYRCEHCEYETRDKHNAKQHFKLKHDDTAELYKCQHCEFKTKNKYHFKKHYDLKHGDSAEWYKCVNDVNLKQ